MPSSFFALHCKMVQKIITIMKQNTSKSYMCTLIITLERLPFQISTLNSKPLTVHQLPVVEWLDFSKGSGSERRLKKHSSEVIHMAKTKRTEHFNNTFVHNISVGKQFFPCQVDLLLNASYFLLPIFKGCSKHNKTLKLALRSTTSHEQDLLVLNYKKSFFV